jgi:S1-C subfamily serine protease
VPGDFLDLILLVLIVAFAVAGYRQGFIIGVLSLGGFVAGVAAGAFIAPGVARALAKTTPWQAFVAILLLFLAAVIGMLVASGIGVAVRSRLTARPATVVDSVGGAVVNVMAVLIVAWLIGSLVAGAPFPTISKQVNNSVVLGTVDKLMPRDVLYLPTFPQLHSLLASGGLYSQVFDAIGAETSPTLSPADPAVLRSKALASVEPSIVKIQGDAPSCSLQIEGSGFVISPQHVLTNAHVVAGVTQGPTVTAGSRIYRARVVLYDPDSDLAVLDVPGLPETPLHFAGPASDGANAVVAGYPLNHSLTIVPARVGSAETADGPNIYETAQVRRQIYAIRAEIEPGNSGGPLLTPDGNVYGVVFAAATTLKDIGYALTSSQVATDVDRGRYETTGVSTQACQGG